MVTSLNEVIEFLDIASSKGFINNHTVLARKTACNKLFDILEENQKNVEYVQDNMGVIKARFTNLNKEVRGNTIDEYARRAQLAVNDFVSWKSDRPAWERDISARQSTRPVGDTEKKMRTPKAEKPKPQMHSNENSASDASKPESRVVSFPIRADFDITVTLPKAGITVAELQKLGYFLLPYVNDWKPNETPHNMFPKIERE